MEGVFVEGGFEVGADVIVALVFSEVFTNVKVPNFSTGLSPLKEPSVLFVRR